MILTSISDNFHIRSSNRVMCNNKVRTCVASGAMLVAFLGLRIGIPNAIIATTDAAASNSLVTTATTSVVTNPNALLRHLTPFASAVSVLGGVGHFLALLIMSNKYGKIQSGELLFRLLTEFQIPHLRSTSEISINTVTPVCFMNIFTTMF
jgi:hypothetical protein